MILKIGIESQVRSQIPRTETQFLHSKDLLNYGQGFKDVRSQLEQMNELRQLCIEQFCTVKELELIEYQLKEEIQQKDEAIEGL